MFQRTNTVILCIYSLFASSTIARHAHRRPLHRHAPRSEATPSAIVVNDEPQPILTSTTLDAPGDAVLDDILKIQAGLKDLPEDLLAIISSFEHRLSEIEKVLAGYLDEPALPTSTNSPIGPVGPILSPAPPPASQASPTAREDTSLASSELPSTVTVTIETDFPTTTSLATITTMPEQEATSSFLRTRSTRITRTLTLVTTIPAPPLATGIINNNNNDTLPVVNGTTGSFVPPAPWTVPYLVSSSSGFSSSFVAPSTAEASELSEPVETPSTSTG